MLESSLRALPLALLLAAGFSNSPAASPALQVVSVSIDGPIQVPLGGKLDLLAQGTPSGGTYLWTYESQGLRGPSAPPDPPARLQAAGDRASVRGLRTSSSLGDIQIRVFYQVGDEVASARTRLSCVDGNLTSYRPQHGAGYGVFPRTPVAEQDEESALLGPGIRINGNGDTDPGGEDDLIEVALVMQPPGARYRLRRGSAELSLWTTRNKQAGTELAFSGAVTADLVGDQTIWVEWSGVDQGAVDLRLVPAGPGPAVDRLFFSSFQSIVMALGGESQVPSNPLDPNHGTFVVGLALYQAGYDVFLHDEDDVAPNGSGSVYDECATAISDRAVGEVVAFGYSHGGGSTFDLLERLDTNRPSLGAFSVPFTSYVDGVENDSDVDVSQERRRPIGSDYHANHYQRGSLADFFLDGGPVNNSNPGPSGLDVESVPFGQGATHFVVDDYAEVTSFIQSNLLLRVQR